MLEVEEEEIPIRNHKGTWCVFGKVWCVEGFCSNCCLNEIKFSRDIDLIPARGDKPYKIDVPLN